MMFIKAHIYLLRRLPHKIDDLLELDVCVLVAEQKLRCMPFRRYGPQSNAFLEHLFAFRYEEKEKKKEEN